MDRWAAFIVTGGSAAPLLALAGFALTSTLARKGEGSDATIAAGSLGILGAVAFAAAGFMALGYLAQRFVTPAHVRYLFVADAVVFVAGLVAWKLLLAGPPALEYADRQPVLEVEARISKTLL